MKISLFISYTTGDKQHFDKLEAYLKYLQRQVNITYSHAELIPGGVSRQQWLRDRIEQSQLNDFHYRHLLFVDDDEQPVGLATFYRVTTDIAIFAPPWLRRAWVCRRCC